ncbi:hypothetical protein FHQ69_27335, partial [Escherichia coli]|nr:hypothetical protein [Escherichia coli]
ANAARACWHERYQNCVIWSCAPSVFSAGAAGASCSGWRAAILSLISVVVNRQRAIIEWCSILLREVYHAYNPTIQHYIN